MPRFCLARLPHEPVARVPDSMVCVKWCPVGFTLNRACQASPTNGNCPYWLCNLYISVDFNWQPLEHARSARLFHRRSFPYLLRQLSGLIQGLTSNGSEIQHDTTVQQHCHGPWLPWLASNCVPCALSSFSRDFCNQFFSFSRMGPSKLEVKSQNTPVGSWEAFFP